MGRWYWIHATSDCEYCVNAVKLLNLSGFQYVLSLYDRNPTILQGTKDLWNHKTTPIIVEYRVSENPVLIGGFDDLVEYFTVQGYMPQISQPEAQGE